MKGKKTGGRLPGSKNKLTGAHGDFLAAWDKLGGPKTAIELLKDAMSKARGYPVVEETFDGNGTLIKRVSKQEYNYGPFVSILPFIARRLEALDLSKLTEGEGKILSVTLKMTE